ncbi:MAG: hypothetical protein IJO70_05275 [Lachnospiraceae bacterium]|nr:hypothetical protein [Lachnospiraceae bacterium]
MGYKIDYKKLIKLRNKLDELLNELETDAKNLTILSEYMYDSCSINCKAARSVKAYIKDVHISAISPYILNAIDVVRTITTEYFYEMYEIDNGEDSVIQEEHLENLEGKLYGLKNKACEILFELEKYAEAISDIMDVTTKNAEELEPYFDEQKLIVTKLKNEFALYESEKLEEAKTAQEVINGFYTKVSNYGNDNLDITQYDGEYYIEPLPTEGLPEVEQLYDELGYNDEENAIDTLGEVGGIISIIEENCTTTLSGRWEKVNESMGDFSRNYQLQITGYVGMAWVQNGVKFDGMKDGILLEAKGKYSQFVNKETGEFFDWFSGKQDFVEQARRQIAASENARIQWYFAEEETLNAVQDLFMEYGITGIELIYEEPQ